MMVRRAVPCLLFSVHFDACRAYSIRNKNNRWISATYFQMEMSLEPTNAIQYFLVKSEPDEFSIDHLKDCHREEWTGVRNFQARNIMRTMRVNDRIWFYHSSCKVPAIVGECRVARTAAPDATALDPTSKYYDPKSTHEKCRWDSVLVELAEVYETSVTLKELRAQAAGNETIAGMRLLNRSRLSVMPVSDDEWNAVLELQKRKEAGEDLLNTASEK